MYNTTRTCIDLLMYSCGFSLARLDIKDITRRHTRTWEHAYLVNVTDTRASVTKILASVTPVYTIHKVSQYRSLNYRSVIDHCYRLSLDLSSMDTHTVYNAYICGAAAVDLCCHVHDYVRFTGDK